MKARLALTGCSTMAPEFRACFKQLGVPTKLYASKPTCLFGTPMSAVDALLARASEEQEQTLVAMGSCCGDVSEIARAHGATVIRADNCRHFYLGPETYEWCIRHSILPMPAHCFRMTLRQAPEPLRELLDGAAAAAGCTRIAAIDDGVRRPDPAGLALVTEMTGLETFVLHTGLGHLRETLRDAAQDAGVPAPTEPGALIDPRALGPGDDCLLVGHNGLACLDSAAELVGTALRRNLQCVWVMGKAKERELLERLALTSDHVRAQLEAGALSFVAPDGLVADAQAETEPGLLVRQWKSRALDALNHGYAGLAVIHGYGWSEQADLPLEYVLDYASRMSAACALWPLLSASELPAQCVTETTFDELRRTHPLLWLEEGVRAEAMFVRSCDYLGGEELLEELGAGPHEFACREAAPLISAYLDGELTEYIAALVRDHANACPTCRPILFAGSDVKGFLRSLQGPSEPPPDFWAGIQARLRDE